MSPAEHARVKEIAGTLDTLVELAGAHTFVFIRRRVAMRPRIPPRLPPAVVRADGTNRCD